MDGKSIMEQIRLFGIQMVMNYPMRRRYSFTLQTRYSAIPKMMGLVMEILKPMG